MTEITELAPAMKAAAELITSGYSRKWIVSHDDETCWVGANDDDGNLTPFIEVSIADWSGNKADNEALARFIALCRPTNILALVEALEHYKSREERVTKLVHDNSKSWDELYQQLEAKDKRNAELVEALEKAQQRITELSEGKVGNALLERENHHIEVVGKLIEHIEQLESRTVTVKFSPIPVEELGNVRDGKKHPYMFGAGYNAAVIHCESVIQQELDAKGIKWEAE
ncbi:ead/Ea22-like family protein [Klebsiella oxytoca]|uniref:ead/Ea22-like family protein n=1 Tax=Klebsiella oxytoca TaxID=571 RepID=UPI000BA11699|nr:ead/Ea22-like family protein [Klebsiella oxytoca]ELG4817330.1 ead/Ea22-like family protein [Klebsiella oxytoca]ELK5564147.1 ead/Ea22-like family protein [Klebsiella oxytoca]ELK5574124.1 ead/Ea22-like family protein [Klebsiella oxytoca]ELM1665574.1 ead/Ea22-like family protein [Klebsiella oxytoca]MCY3431425.1 ead/Ea22-like family protein [Klebsiella oxytoca]